MFPSVLDIMKTKRAKGVTAMPNDEIYALKDRIVEQLSPLKVYLFEIGRASCRERV